MTTFGSQPNISTKPTLYMSTHMQSVAEGVTGYRRATTFWKSLEEHWGWLKNSLPIQAQRSDKHTYIFMNLHIET